nr:MAG TPA: hypothetical protein [Caudoviricetes sp.]
MLYNIKWLPVSQQIATITFYMLMNVLILLIEYSTYLILEMQTRTH